MAQVGKQALEISKV